jgi:hypothetical protein
LAIIDIPARASDRSRATDFRNLRLSLPRFAMADDEIMELKCRFCGGPLHPDEQKDPKRGKHFRFYRCESCNMPNVIPIGKSGNG